VANAEDEAVATQPAVFTWIVAHNLVEQKISDRGKANSGTWVSVSNLFNGISGKYARGVYSF
jgi:hypothetical protein